MRDAGAGLEREGLLVVRRRLCTVRRSGPFSGIMEESEVRNTDRLRVVGYGVGI